MTPIKDLVRAYFRAYETKDRPAIEILLADDFRFKSPVDELIDRAAYFSTCWPHSTEDRVFDILTLLSDGNEALVRYDCRWKDGHTHRCAEYFRGDGAKIVFIDVYFGFWPKTD